MLVSGPFHSTNNPMVGMAYLRAYLEQRGIACPTHDLNIESRAFLQAAVPDPILIRRLYSASSRTYLAEAMAWSWLDPDGPRGVIGRALTDRSAVLADFWRNEGIDQLDTDPVVARASCLLRGWLLKRTREIARSAGTWVGFSTAITNLASNLFVARELKSLRPELVTIFGGPEVTSRNAPEMLASFPFIDAAIPAPAYASLAWLAQNTESIGQRRVPAGVVWRSGDTIEAGAQGQSMDLDEIPPANWTSFPMGLYDVGFVLKDLSSELCKYYPTIPVHTSQGCSYNRCDFCYNTSLYSSFATRAPVRVVAELHHQIRVMGTRGFFFTDFEFNAVPSRVAEICRLIRQTGDSIRFYAWLRLDKTDKELLERVYEAGARQIFIGVEAVDDEILTLMRKGYDARLALERLEMLHEFVGDHPDFRYEFNIISNYPGETLGSVRNTLAQIAENPHLFLGHVAAVVDFMLHEGSPAHVRLAGSAVGCMTPLLPRGAAVRSYRHLLQPDDTPDYRQRVQIWAAVRALLQHEPGRGASYQLTHASH
jgi:hypothetical protein